MKFEPVICLVWKWIYRKLEITQDFLLPNSKQKSTTWRILLVNLLPSQLKRSKTPEILKQQHLSRKSFHKNRSTGKDNYKQLVACQSYDCVIGLQFSPQRVKSLRTMTSGRSRKFMQPIFLLHHLHVWSTNSWKTPIDVRRKFIGIFR